MTKLITLALAAVVAASLAGCGSLNNDTPPPVVDAAATPTANTTTEKPSEKPLVGTIGEKLAYGNFLGKNITWECLAIDISDKDNPKALLTSTDIVFYWPFNASGGEAAWADSTLRDLLNGKFYDDAFTDAQRAKIIPADIDGAADKVFLLSLEEATLYFADDAARIVSYNATDAQMDALAQAIADASDTEGWAAPYTVDNALSDLIMYNGTTDKWWLRTSDESLTRASCVSYNGAVGTDSSLVKQLQAVRPVMWVTLKAE